MGNVEKKAGIEDGKEPVFKAIEYQPTATEQVALRERCATDRDDLLGQVLELYPSLEGKLPAELVEDIFYDVLHHGLTWVDLAPGQLYVQDLNFDVNCNGPQLRVNSRLAKFLDAEGAAVTSLQNTVLAKALGHVRLHTDELLEMMASPDFGDSLPPGSMATWKERQAWEAAVYATTFLVPPSQLPKLAAGKDLLKAWESGRDLSPEIIWIKIRSLARELKTIPSAVKRALVDLEWLNEENGVLKLVPAYQRSGGMRP